jgi:nucleotide-binding universal stress UspA family protein
MYTKILVPIDGSATSLLGLGEAIKLAKSSGATLRIVHVVNEYVILDAAYVPSNLYEMMIEPLLEAGRKMLKDAESRVREQGLEPQSALLDTVGGRVADLIVEDARQWPADLIVMGTHGRRGLRRLALGSDAEMVLRTSPVPVLLVRGTPEA